MKLALNYRELEGKSTGFWVLLGGLGLLIALALGATLHMEHSGHYVTGMSNQIVWGMPHVFAIFLIVAASGALNVASIGTVFGKPLYKAGFLGRKALARMGLAQVMYLLFGADEDQLSRARDELLHLIAGWQRDEIEQLVRETLTDVAEPLVYAEALFLIDEHARRGRRVIIISASPEEIVRPIAEHIGVREVIATKVKTDTQGRYLPEVDVYAMGPGKAEAMEELARTAGLDLEGELGRRELTATLPWDTSTETLPRLSFL